MKRFRIRFAPLQFRFELPFGESSEDVLYSPATPVYQTPAAGAPISAPIIETLLALDESHVAVHWLPGRYSNAPIEGYRVQLDDSRDQVGIEMPSSLSVKLTGCASSHAAAASIQEQLHLWPAAANDQLHHQTDHD